MPKTKRSRRYSKRYSPYKRKQKFAFSGAGNIPRSISVTNARFNIARDTRVVEYGTINLPTSGDSTFSKEFKLSDLPNSTDYSLYDQYRITAIKIEICTNYGNTTYFDSETPPGVGTVVPASRPWLYTCLDYDDAGVPASKSFVLDRSTCRFHGCLDRYGKVVRWLKPQVAAQIYKSAVATGYGGRTSPWLDVDSSADVPHYGLKGVVTNLSANPSSQNKLILVATFYLEFKFSS